MPADRPASGRPELVIFDCDGVLVDTERATNRVMAEYITTLGWAITPEDNTRMFKGRDLKVIIPEVEAKIGRSVPDFTEAYRARMYEAFDRGVDPMPGANETLDALDRLGIPWCVASNGPREKMLASLRASDLLERVGGLPDRPEDDRDGAKVFSAYDIGVWKPAPDLFLHAAGRFDTAPEACVVIEDSVSGIRAAKAGGMRCVGVADLSPESELIEAGADPVITTMENAIDALGLA